MKKLIIFDLDDTLCDYNGAKEKAIAELTKSLNKNLIDSTKFWKIYREKEPILFRKFVMQEITIEEYRKHRYMDILVEAGYEGENVERLAYKLNLDYMDITNNQVELYPETDKVLEDLAKEGYKIAILTNGPLDGQTKKIKKFNLQNKVDNIYYSAKIGFGKPAKEAFEYVINDMGVKKEEAVMIGDSMRDDYMGALNANIQAILIERKKENWNKEFKGIRVHSLNEISKILNIFM